jgi:hypothetical protein
LSGVAIAPKLNRSGPREIAADSSHEVERLAHCAP